VSTGRPILGAPLMAACAAMVAAAPIAAADPACPARGEQTARVVIDDLAAEGYDVQINWLNGQSYRSLCECTAPAVHNPNRSGGPPETFTTVYVDVFCPDHDDDSGFQIGIGF
jgi:hypothetical protein